MNKLLAFLLLVVLLLAQNALPDGQFYPEQADRPSLIEEIPTQQYEQKPAEQPQRNAPQNPFDHPPADPNKKSKKGEFRQFGYRNGGANQLPAQGAKIKRSKDVYGRQRNAWKEMEGQMQSGEGSWADSLMDSNITRVAAVAIFLLVVIRMRTRGCRPSRMAPRHVPASIKFSNDCFQEQTATDDTVNSQGVYASSLQNHPQRSQNAISSEDEQ